MLIHNLIKYNYNYADLSGQSWLPQTDKTTAGNANVTIDNSTPFKYKFSLTGVTEAEFAKGGVASTKRAVPV